MQKYFENELITTARSETFAGGFGRKRVVEAVIDLIGDEPGCLRLRRSLSAGERVGIIMVPVGLAGLRSHAFERRALVRREQGFWRQRPTRFRRCLDQDRLATEGGQDVPIRRIAGLAKATRSPGSNSDRKARMKPPEDPW